MWIEKKMKRETSKNVKRKSEAVWAQRYERMLKQKIRKLQKKIANKKKNMRDQVISNLTKDRLEGDIIIFPKLNFHNFSFRVLRRIGSNLSICSLVDSLHHKCKEKGIILAHFNESQTTRCCSLCGEPNFEIGSKKWFMCPQNDCGNSKDRDVDACLTFAIKTALILGDN